jgi:hypothetical protein
LPVVLASVLVLLGVRATETSPLLSIVAFLGGFLFALLILVLEMAAGAAADRGLRRASAHVRRIVVLREMCGNVSYGVLICISTSAVLIIGAFTGTQTVIDTATSGVADGTGVVVHGADAGGAGSPRAEAAHDP